MSLISRDEQPMSCRPIETTAGGDRLIMIDVYYDGEGIPYIKSCSVRDTYSDNKETE